MHFVQRFVDVDMLLGRRAYHPSEKLRDIGIIDSATEGHHGFRSGTVPSGRKRFLEENDLDAFVIRNAAGFAVRNIQSGYLDSRSTFAKSVNDLSFQEAVTETFLDNPQAVVQIGSGYLMSCAVLHLNDKDRFFAQYALDSMADRSLSWYHRTDSPDPQNPLL